MPKYDPNDDVYYGVTGSDFPISFYDRPQLAFANLLKGNIDGVTRAMLSPSTLTPSQIQTVRQVLMPNSKRPNPFIKTITDIASNPLVIMGLIVGMYKFPLGTTKPLLELRRGLLPKSAAMNSMFSGLHDAMMNLRHIPGMFESLLGVTKETADFMAKHGNKANQIFLKSGKLNRAEGALVAARLDGLHKPNHFMVKALRNEPEWRAFMGGKDVPIAPNIQNSMDGRLIGLSDRLRGWYNEVRKKITSSPEVKARIKEAVEKKGLKFGEDVEDYFPRQGHFNRYYQQAIRGTTGVQYRKWLQKEVAEKVGREEISRTGGLFASLEDLRRLEQSGAVKSGFSDMVESILRRRSSEASSTIESIWNKISGLGLNDAQERAAFVKQVRDHYTKGPGKNLNFVARLGSPKVANDTLDAMAGALQNARFRGSEAITKELGEIGKVLASPAQYSLNPWEATGRYLNSVSSSYAWHGTGLGKRIMDITRQPGVFKEAPYLESYLMDNLIPHVQGLKSYQQMQRSLSFSVRKEKIYNWIKASPFVESALGEKTKSWLLNYFGQGPKSLSAEGIAAKISHAFYLSTLGANISPASKNLLQNLLTTVNAPGIGPQGLYRGLMGYAGQPGALSRMRTYVSKISSGVKSEKAFAEAFPEYVKDMGEASNIVESLLAGDVAKEGFTKAIAGRGAWDKVKKGLLMPFSTSEAFNRIVGYYAGRNSHLYHNASVLASGSAEAKKQILKEAGQVGQSLTMMSHFSGGPLGIPKAIMNLPSPARQFMHFPIRYMGFLQGSTRLGADPNKMDWGTIGRTLAGSTSIYLAARNMLGVNLESGLLSGALPVPQYENAPFYPFPLVPPAFSVVGQAAKALATGETRGLDATAAMLVPGGVGFRRLYRSLSPKYADYSTRTEDGRIPLYNDDGSLVGSVRPMQLVLKSLGLQVNDVAGERGAAEWLVKQRDRIRQYKRDYLQALYENDHRKAENINRDFQKVYPELGPMRVKKSDIRALENRRETSRVQRIIRGIPKDYKPLFNQVLAEAQLGSFTQNVEMGDMGLVPQYLNQ